MKSKKNNLISSRSFQLFLLSTVAATFCFIGMFLNVYRYAITGAIFELLWLPIICLLLVLPILSILYMVKEKFKRSWFYLFTILICVGTVILMFFKK